MSKFALSLAAGLIVFTSWGFAASRAQPHRNMEARARFEMGMRLGDALRDPHSLTKSDVKAAKKAWGRDSADLLELLRRTSR